MHRRWWQDRHITTVQCKIGSNNLLVCLRGHLIGATRSHELQEGTLADQGDPSDHSKILGEGPTVVSRFDWIQSLGLTHRKSVWFNLHVLLYCRIRGISATGLGVHFRKNVDLHHTLHFLFLFYSYMKSHIDNDSRLPTYMTIPAICNTPRLTCAYGIPFFRTSSWWLCVVGRVVVCGLWLCVGALNRGCAKNIQKTTST